MAQLSSQYLMHCQEVLSQKCQAVQGNVNFGLAELKKLHEKFGRRKERRRVLKAEVNKLDDLISKYDVVLKSMRPDLSELLVKDDKTGAILLKVSSDAVEKAEREKIEKVTQRQKVHLDKARKQIREDSETIMCLRQRLHNLENRLAAAGSTNSEVSIQKRPEFPEAFSQDSLDGRFAEVSSIFKGECISERASENGVEEKDDWDNIARKPEDESRDDSVSEEEDEAQYQSLNERKPLAQTFDTSFIDGEMDLTLIDEDVEEEKQQHDLCNSGFLHVDGIEPFANDHELVLEEISPPSKMEGFEEEENIRQAAETAAEEGGHEEKGNDSDEEKSASLEESEIEEKTQHLQASHELDSEFGSMALQDARHLQIPSPITPLDGESTILNKNEISNDSLVSKSLVMSVSASEDEVEQEGEDDEESSEDEMIKRRAKSFLSPRSELFSDSEAESGVIIIGGQSDEEGLLSSKPWSENSFHEGAETNFAATELSSDDG